MFNDLFKSLSSRDDDKKDDYRYGTTNDSHDSRYRDDDHETYGRMFKNSSNNDKEEN